MSVQPCAELDEFSYDKQDEDVAYLDASTDMVDGVWRIPTGWVRTFSDFSSRRVQIKRVYTRTVSFMEFRPEITTHMIATLNPPSPHVTVIPFEYLEW